jgi:hypothetical protein
VDDIYANLDAVGRMKFRGAALLPRKLHEGREAVQMARRLTGLRYDAPVAADERSLARRPPALGLLGALYDEAGFGSGLRRQAERL